MQDPHSKETDWTKSLREKLDQHYAWPALYIFKFIVPKGKADEVKQLFPFHTVTEKVSKNGNYTSLTIQMMAPSSDTVIEVYLKTSEIEGLIAL
jgi:putative lipoic acid-binding regulatory protein